jgi:hypothetical protein
VIPLVAIGARAQAALRHTGGRATLLAPLSESIYLTAGGQVIWLGRAGATLHARAMLTAAALPSCEDGFVFDAADLSPWRPAALPGALDPARVRSACAALVARVREGAAGESLGLGALLAGRPLAFPLAAARPHAVALAEAAATDAPAAAIAAALPLLGLGPGLTPSGDDFVGGVFFARALLGAGGTDARAWSDAGAAVAVRAQERTHPVSAALLSDLVAGHGYAPLHDLARAFASGEHGDTALDAARRLTRIGHSSGWDMLAGLAAALLGPRTFAAAGPPAASPR